MLAASKHGEFVSGRPALYHAICERVRLRAGAAFAASHLIAISKGAALAQRKKTLRPFAA